MYYLLMIKLYQNLYLYSMDLLGVYQWFNVFGSLMSFAIRLFNANNDNII